MHHAVLDEPTTSDLAECMSPRLLYPSCPFCSFLNCFVEQFRRRSVEGLSMLLFIMAFVGNSLYVLSILINPLLKTPGYLLESTPYLLGSGEFRSLAVILHFCESRPLTDSRSAGGTLCFDITIILQSVLYSNKRKAAQVCSFSSVFSLALTQSLRSFRTGTRPETKHPLRCRRGGSGRTSPRRRLGRRRNR
jgi:hypothetical protein